MTLMVSAIENILENFNLTLINNGSPTRFDPHSGVQTHIDLTLSTSKLIQHSMASPARFVW